MLEKIFAYLTVISFVCAALNGNMTNVSEAVSSASTSAVELSVSLLGSMCLWSGVARVLDKGGLSSILETIVSPILRIVLPDSFKKKNGIRECAASISANFLGLGNAALPASIAAMKKISENSHLPDGKASNDAVMLAVLATTPFQLLPNTLAAMRAAAGSAAPYEILLPVWICEILTTVIAVLLCKILSLIF